MIAEFNMNDYVFVRLNDHGRAILREKQSEILRAHPEMKDGSAFSGDAVPPEDEDGWSRWQMWRLMGTFGQHIYLGCDPPFEIVIRLSAAEPVKLQESA